MKGPTPPSVERTDAANRGRDLDRLVSHVREAPEQVSPLVSLLLLIDDDMRDEVECLVDTFRAAAAPTLDDVAIVALMMVVYRDARATLDRPA